MNVLYRFSILCLSALLACTGLDAQNWNPLNNMPSPRHHPVTFSLNGTGYMLTGSTQTESTTKDFYSYDPSNDAWTQRTDFPGTARGFAIGASYQGLGYMGFGASDNGLLNDLWVFDPTSDQWSQLASCPCAGRRHPAFVIENGKIYVGLGDGDVGDLRDFHVYDIGSNSWTQIGSLPASGRHHPFHFAAAGEVYAGMGHSGFTIYGDWYRFNPTSMGWTSMSPFPGEARVAGTQFDHGGKGYVLSGDGDNHSYMPSGEFWEYEPGTDTWTQLPPHPGISLWAPGSFVINDKVYFFGGYDRQTGTFPSSVWEYQLSPNNVSIKAEYASTKVYPNPVMDVLKIESQTTGPMHWRLYGLRGGELIREGRSKQIDMHDLPNGSYILVLQERDRDYLRTVLQKN